MKKIHLEFRHLLEFRGKNSPFLSYWSLSGDRLRPNAPCLVWWMTTIIGLQGLIGNATGRYWCIYNHYIYICGDTIGSQKFVSCPNIIALCRPIDDHKNNRGSEVRRLFFESQAGGFSNSLGIRWAPSRSLCMELWGPYKWPYCING